MRNFRITFLIVGCLFAFGIYGLVHIPKQEFPEYTIRQGVVVGVYPGATSEEVEQQLAKPLEQFLMTYKEVKRSKTTSTSQNGMCYVMVELEDHVNDSRSCRRALRPWSPTTTSATPRRCSSRSNPIRGRTVN